MGTINTGDTAFILISAALVFFMTPGLALFYGGMVKRKNVLSTMMASFFILGLSSVLWVAIGYTLSFGEGGSFFGGFQWAFLNGVEGEVGTIPHTLFAVFQLMFAVITAAILTGSLVERMKFSALFFFIALWSLIIYYPLAHMVWGPGGFILELGALDFAGGNVVHISSGVSGLVAAIILGKRKGYGVTSTQPHNIPLVVLGAGILWFGWFGFNAGSALSAGTLASHAFITTNTSAAMALLSWMLVEKITRGKPTLLGAATGAVVGLVAITPGAGFVPVWASFIIGALVSPICYFAMSVIKPKFGYDDSLDAFGCHGIGGIWGGIATGLFASNKVNEAVANNGLIFGETKLIVAQLIAIAITIVLATVGTAAIMYILKAVLKGVRVTPREESEGLDIAQHGESAYPSFTGMD
ncbi:ammonium transporter NrgA [Ruminiclostridium hungatei]|uniref:Ammonium transporter n=1 Tax=Ruminiclostridium hungatei TaxID=48256 RepID=A0A1V4SE80_RUMHU|nr:ammonium transporter [Ruminiclostridium hungatei]OPX42168.1 ammonium transporter NrgA [Ruminiclostridium hungatei]